MLIKNVKVKKLLQIKEICKKCFAEEKNDNNFIKIGKLFKIR